MAAYISLTAQRELKIVVPPIEEQQAIAAVLGSLDDKIDQNRRHGTGTGSANAGDLRVVVRGLRAD
ncbi:MAG: restriction endonuclease subunit S [Acidimicrobiales bacterium]|nr:restriction endonuclease subunit S [Acidimicrobiales bacterium]